LALESLISQDTIVVENHEDVVRAIEEVRASNAAFSDALIALLGLRAGCSATLTFRRKATKRPGFLLATR
jgi:predicted nucleic-acid-binding protein